MKTDTTQKVTNIAYQLPTYSDEGTNNLGQVTNISCNTRFASFFQPMFLYELLKFSNPQIRAFGWKWIQLKNLPTLAVSYEHLIIKVPTIWP